MEKLNQEKLDKALQRNTSYSIHEILNIKGFKNYLGAYACLYIKWSLVKETLVEQDNTLYDSNNR
jgi:hypothetical protein